MSFEQPNINSQEAEQDPEVLEEAQKLNERLQSLTEELKRTDSSELDSDQMGKVQAGMEMFFNALIIALSAEGMKLVAQGTMEDVMKGSFTGLEATIAGGGEILAFAFLTYGIKEFVNAAKQFLKRKDTSG